jgi:hypothetical protein
MCGKALGHFQIFERGTRERLFGQQIQIHVGMLKTLARPIDQASDILMSCERVVHVKI